MGAFVVGDSDGLEPFLAGSVPDLQLDRLVSDPELSDLEVDSNGGEEAE
jgi:hypothetical protein